MTKQLTKQEVEAVVERLDETILRNISNSWCQNPPILIGTVLENIDAISESSEDGINEELIRLWRNAGSLSKSLQEIIEASGWEYTLTAQDEDSSIRKAEVLTSPEANALFSFLQEIL